LQIELALIEDVNSWDVSSKNVMGPVLKDASVKSSTKRKLSIRPVADKKEWSGLKKVSSKAIRMHIAELCLSNTVRWDIADQSQQYKD